VVVASFEVVFQYFPEGMRKSTESLGQDSLPRDQEMNPEPPKYEKLVLTIHL
jgi:hypothetical protein